MVLKLLDRIRTWIKERNRKHTLEMLEERTTQLEHAYWARPYRTYDMLHGDHDPTSFTRESHNQAYAGIRRLAIKDGIDIKKFDGRVFEARRVFYFQYRNRL